MNGRADQGSGMGKETKIGVIGWYRHPNFGDQLLFNVLHQWLKELLPASQIMVPWGNPEIDWPSGEIRIGGGWKALFGCDAVVFGGGGYLGEPGEEALRAPAQFTQLDRLGGMLHLPRALGGGYFGATGYLRAETRRFVGYAMIANALRLKRIPYCVLGVGVGPVTTRIGRRAVTRVLKSARAVCLRDVESTRHAERMCAALHLRTTADMVLSMCSDLNGMPSSDCVAVHMGPHVLKRVTLEDVARAVAALLEAGLHVSMLSDCRPPVKGSEDQLRTTVQKQFGERVRFNRYSNTESLLRELTDFGFVLTSKLHVGIAGYAAGALPVAVPQHTKTQRFFRQVGLLDYCFDLSPDGLDRAVGAIRRLKASPETRQRLLVDKREEVTRKALENREVLAWFVTHACRPLA